MTEKISYLFASVGISSIFVTIAYDMGASKGYTNSEKIYELVSSAYLKGFEQASKIYQEIKK